MYGQNKKKCHTSILVGKLSKEEITWETNDDNIKLGFGKTRSKDVRWTDMIQNTAHLRGSLTMIINTQVSYMCALNMALRLPVLCVSLGLLTA